MTAELAGRGAFTALVALLLAASLAAGAVAPVAGADKSKATAPRLSEEQKILHALNRLGFGPRPGDVERVRRIGLDKYIEQQLSPGKVGDSAVEARLDPLKSLGLSIADIYDRYPQPQQVAMKLGMMRPGELDQQPKPSDPVGAPAASGKEGDKGDKGLDRERRQKVMAYYADNGLKPPNALLQELQAQKLIRAVYSERQLQEVMSDFWFNHFNIFWGKGADRWMTTDFEMNAIRPHTMGKFKDLLMATAKSPAMLFYLDNFQSMSPDAQIPGRRGLNRRGLFKRKPGQMAERNRGSGRTGEQPPRAQAANRLRNRQRGINENYAREIMELHTLGVDGGYTQKDVQEVARALTGWTIDQPRQSGRFIFREWMHDDGEKVVLGRKISSGGGIEDGEKVIEILASHPNTAKFISTKLVRRFVSDNPPASLVEKVTRTYMKTGGDISEMLRTIFTSKEFFAPEFYRAKIKSPFELAVSAIRALDGDMSGTLHLSQFISRMGQPLYLYQPPTGYPDRAEQWVNTGALLERLNFGLALSANRVRGASVDIKRAAPAPDNGGAGEVMELAIAVLLNGEISPQTRAILEKQLREGVPVKGELGKPERAAANNGMDEMSAGDAMAPDYERPGRPNARGPRQGRRAGWQADEPPGPPAPSASPEVAKVFGLVLGSPEFQRR
ncbi:MAG TPA: DUF1800 domain-containing protein [Blastocatellia bacterium]|nr:DUF1800 domain-containing protein [Blastocatellia bacterium]